MPDETGGVLAHLLELGPQPLQRAGLVRRVRSEVDRRLVTDEIVHLDATQEEDMIIAQASAEIDPKTNKLTRVSLTYQEIDAWVARHWPRCVAFRHLP